MQIMINILVIEIIHVYVAIVLSQIAKVLRIKKISTKLDSSTVRTKYGIDNNFKEIKASKRRKAVGS